MSEPHYLPIEPGTKRPIKLPGSYRRLSPDDATSDPETLARWFDAVPDANRAMHCRLSGRVVIDVEEKPGRNGEDRLLELVAELGELPPTIECLTGGGGRHLHYQDPGGELVGWLAPKEIEVRCNGIVLVPPSVHPHTGRLYEWSVDGHPDEVEPAELPEPWIARMRRPERPARPAPPGERGDDADFLRRRPPAEYVRLLAGLKVPGRWGWKIHCPFPDHDDRSPSLHVYETAKRGWYCYGCGRGGGIYEFAACLAGLPLPLRGSAFLRVEWALLAVYEEADSWRSAA